MGRISIKKETDEKLKNLDLLISKKNSENKITGSFIDKDFSYFMVVDTIFKDCIFDKCTFDKIDFTFVAFKDCIFRNCSIKKGDFFEVYFENCNLINNKFNQSVLKHVKQYQGNLYSNDFEDVVFCSTTLSGEFYENNNLVVLPVVDCRGYVPVAIWTGGKKWMIYSGCRTFSIKGARKHWDLKSYIGDKDVASRYIHALEWLEKYHTIPQHITCNEQRRHLMQLVEEEFKK